jgi:hypothetical protein
MRSLTLNYYQDPGHGWVKVNKKVLNDLSIADDISAYSYMRGDFAYLEEDCDLSRLMAAAQAAGITVKLREYCSRERSSKIRSYEAYKPKSDIEKHMEWLMSTGRVEFYRVTL